ncbi:MAG: response regulator transcription factor [Ferruginibacter sp.]|nr:response regulator transcription factor [Ferruginibacter sp.]
MVKIAIAEDNAHALITLIEKLSEFDDICLVHQAGNGSEILHLLESNSDIDLILMDIEMPVMNGIAATERIKQMYPTVKVVIITIFDNDDYIFNAIKAGADSYILKDIKPEKIYETIKDTLQGGAVMSPSIAVKTLSLLKNIHLPVTPSEVVKIALTERESEILEQLSKGYSNKVIAASLFISPFTVKRHIENIYQKLHAHNRIDLVEKARKGGLL